MGTQELEGLPSPIYADTFYFIHKFNASKFMMRFGVFLQTKCSKPTYLFVFLTALVLVFTEFCNIFDFQLFSKFIHSEVILFRASVTLFFGWIAAKIILGHFIPSFSIRRTLLRIFYEPQQAAGNRLDVLDVFRVIAICWVIANHLGSEGRIDILERQPSSIAFKNAIHNNPIFGALLGNSALGVEIFLVLSGLLAARSWNQNGINVPFGKRYFSFVVRRWFRIMPSVAIFVLISVSPLTKTFLTRYHSTMIGGCSTSDILKHFTFTSNFASTPTCLGYLWYLSLDMQLYLIAPFIIVLFNQRPRAGILLCIFLISFSAFLRAVYCQIYGVCNQSDVDIPFISFPGDDIEKIKHIYAGLWEMYSRPPTTCGPFIIGLLVGQFLKQIQMYFNFSKIKLNALFGGAFTAAIATIYAILPEYWYPDQGNTLYNTLYTALFRTVFAGAIGLMILSLYCNNNRPQISHFWEVLAKLSFNVYLLHMPIVYLFNYVEFYQNATGVLGLLTMLPFSIVLSFILALFYYCFVEAPLSVLSSNVIRRYL